jgi:hypothetical protein
MGILRSISIRLASGLRDIRRGGVPSGGGWQCLVLRKQSEILGFAQDDNALVVGAGVGRRVRQKVAPESFVQENREHDE